VCKMGITTSETSLLLVMTEGKGCLAMTRKVEAVIANVVKQSPGREGTVCKTGITTSETSLLLVMTEGKEAPRNDEESKRRHLLWFTK